MRAQEIKTLIIDLPNSDDELVAIHPISRGPYMGWDMLYLMHDLCGGYYTVRATVDGEHIDTSETVDGVQNALALVANQKRKQSKKDINAVTGNGRWSCD